jgi:hypothetical protein
MTKETKPETFRELLESLRGRPVQLTLTTAEQVQGALSLHADYVTLEGYPSAIPIAHIVGLALVIQRHRSSAPGNPQIE